MIILQFILGTGYSGFFSSITKQYTCINVGDFFSFTHSNYLHFFQR